MMWYLMEKKRNAPALAQRRRRAGDILTGGVSYASEW